ncbi:MAG: response regulator [Gammaproteobacteria bacterium]|nr:MAG: response regulator [Gammaproteobacteria bacterium]
MKQLFDKTIPLNILFCIAYFTLATLGFEWGALTANATLLWPPSGLTVFGFIVFGRRVFPGLLVGAIISSKIISLANPFANTLISLSVSTFTGCAGILQAMLIAHLARSYYRNEFRVATFPAITFTLRVAVGCIVSATLGNIILWQADIINLKTALQNWAVWWVGDVVGVLIVAPLLLWLYHKQLFQKNSQANAFLIFCAGIGVVLLIVAAMGHSEHETQRKNRNHQAENLQFSIQTNIDLITRDISTLQEYFLNNTPDDTEFKKIIEPFLKRNIWVNSFGWVSVNPVNSKKILMLDFPVALGLTRVQEVNFGWTTFDRSDFPETLLTDLKNHMKPVQSDFFLSAANTGSSDIQASPTVNVTLPVFTCNGDKKNDCKILSLLSLKLDLNSLIGSAVERNQLSNSNIELHIKSNSSSDNLWKWQDNKLIKLTDKRLIKAVAPAKEKIPRIKSFGSEWELFINAENMSIWFLPTFQQFVVLLIGLSLVILLSAYLQALHRQDQLIIGNQAKLEEEIKQQTGALRSANESLLEEIRNKLLTQEQLKASEAHMRTLLDNIPDPVWFKSTEGTYLSINKIVAELFKRSEKDIIGKRAADYVEHDFEKAITEYEQAVLQSEASIRRELWMHIPALNQQRLMDTIKVAVRDENKQPIGILSIARDITEQHRLINELEKFKRFSEYASEGFSIMTLAAETLYMNRSMQKMLSSEERVSHNNFYSYFPADLHHQWQDKILPYVLLKGYWQGELSALRSDGSRFPTKETFFIIRDDKGKAIYIGEVMIDISDQKQVEKSLQIAKETAEDATRAKSRFLANMSHEIRTPLNAILGYSQLLIADSTLSIQQHERMNAILIAGQRLLHLINDVLDLSKIEAGALHVREDYFDLRQELNDIASLMRTKAIAKGLAFKYKAQLPAPAIVQSDRQKIGQVILNLLGNAIKFTQQGEIQLNVSYNERDILIDITDTGPGIATDEMQLLFSAFKQGKSGEESGGTGLGLVISKSIVERLDGELTLDSNPGKGTTARLRLPLRIDYDKQLENISQLSSIKLKENHNCYVLVVEDDDASRDVLVNLLKNIGCEVVEAVNGAEGLSKALARKPDIIFTDIRMPELSGSDMLKTLRKSIARDDLPVIAVSASSLEHERTFYLSEGFHEFISKPYQFSDIYSTLKKFTLAQFQEPQQLNAISAIDIDRANWENPAELISLQIQLQALKSSFNKGDMNNSKKLFALQSTQTLGKDSHHKIQGAMRQYDLVSAEAFLDEVLADINNQLNTP